MSTSNQAYENKEMQSRFETLQQQNSSNGRLAKLMSAMRDGSEIQIYLDLEEKNVLLIKEWLAMESCGMMRSQTA